MSEGKVNIVNPTKEGFLEKQSRHLKRWKRRWFVLQQHMLYSFKDERVYEVGRHGERSNTSRHLSLSLEQDPTEVIDLRVFSSIKSSEEITNRSHSFDVSSSEMSFSMVAASETEKEGL